MSRRLCVLVLSVVALLSIGTPGWAQRRGARPMHVASGPFMGGASFGTGRSFQFQTPSSGFGISPFFNPAGFNLNPAVSRRLATSPFAQAAGLNAIVDASANATSTFGACRAGLQSRDANVLDHDAVRDL